MSLPSIPLAKRQFIEGLILVLGTLGAIVLLNLFVEQSPLVIGVVVTALFAVAWMLFSRDLWWLPVPVAVCLGGMVYVGFKIYAYELGVVLAFIAAIPRLASRQVASARAAFMPSALMALFVYLLLRLGTDLYMAYLDGYQLGNIVRVYMMGLWPLLFAVPLVALGSARRLSSIFWIIYVAALVRTSLGTIGYFFPRIITLTGIQVVLPGIYMEGIELRTSALWLLYLALCGWSLSGRRVHPVHGLVAAFAVAGVFLGGSRVSLGFMIAIILIWMAVERRYVFLGVFSGVVVSLVVLLNLNHELIYWFPERLQRTLSILMMQSPFHDVHRMIEGSDEWHRQLGVIGFNRWVSSPLHFLFGQRLVPFPWDLDQLVESFQLRLQISADLGYYESGLWTVLAVTGLVGGYLYWRTFFQLSRPLWRWVWQNGVRTPGKAFAFIGLCSSLVWLGFSWIAGHFPSEPLMFLLIARTAYEDQKG